ncbi:hypothetical protein AB8616_10055 [Marinomonas sp. RS-M-Aa-14]|uniref:hypothetical protein n=1 Tax=Marinomonas sp. RS-M-Aa-14 TaxID=3241169 RepID=UPI00390CA468
MSELNVFDRSKMIWPYVGKVRQQIDPFDPEQKPVPLRNATDKKLLPEKKGFVQGFVSGNWEYYPASQEYWLSDGSKHKTEDGEELPEGALLKEPPKPEPTFDERLALAIAQREATYKAESDPLYMEWQYDKTDEAEQKWRDKVAEIKERYPLPTE